MSTKREHIPKAIRDQVLTEAGFRCGVPQCTNPLTVEIHHLTPVAKNGGNESANLLPLCPYCHSLFEKGGIPESSLRKYKEILVSRMKPIDPVLARSLAEEVSKLIPSRVTGFNLAFQEFDRRTCKIGFLTGRNFIQTGFGCFIDTGVMLSTHSVISMAEEGAKLRGGHPVVFANVGLASFKALATSPLTPAVTIQVNSFDTSYSEAVAKEKGLPFEQVFFLPIQAPVKYRPMPQIGEAVGVVHSPDSTEDKRSSLSFQFEHLWVSYRNVFSKSKNILDFTLSPPSTKITYAGSPVFGADGFLVGVITDVHPVEGVGRPVASGLLKLDPLKFDGC